MTDPLTDDDVLRLRELCAACSSSLKLVEHPGGRTDVTRDVDDEEFAPNGISIVSCGWGQEPWWDDAEARFLVAARATLPALLDERDSLLREVERLRAEVARVDMRKDATRHAPVIADALPAGWESYGDCAEFPWYRHVSGAVVQCAVLRKTWKWFPPGVDNCSDPVDFEWDPDGKQERAARDEAMRRATGER